MEGIFWRIVGWAVAAIKRIPEASTQKVPTAACSQRVVLLGTLWDEKKRART
jgi:hypothetical protein